MNGENDVFRLAKSFAGNFSRSRLGIDTPGSALFPLYHLTPECNLNCFYCDGFSAGELPPERDRLTPDQIRRVLEIIRKRFSILFLTGGEPFMLDGIDTILAYTKELGFRHVSVNTNLLRMPDHEISLRCIDYIVTSLDSLKPDIYDRAVGVAGATEAIKANILRCASQRDRFDFQITVHCVAHPGKVGEAWEVLEFCLNHRIPFCFSPLQVNYDLHPDLIDDPEYREFITRLIRIKRRTGLVSGSYLYYRNIHDFSDYRCYPWIIPRIFPNGDLIFPCRPRGKPLGNLLETGSWDLLEEKASDLGWEGSCRRSCRIRCYIEPSLLAPRPWNILREFLFHR